MFMSSRGSLILASLCSGWLLLVLLGSAALWQYKQTAGNDPLAPAAWPAVSAIRRQLDQPTLLVFVHPRCPCSQATITELNRLMTHVQRRVHAEVFFFRPRGAAAGWAAGPLWRSAAAIPGIRLHEDEGGIEARLFHGETSGHVVLYDRSGQRIFDGGITPARGHEGDSPGLSSLLALLHEQASERRHTPVFGCQIRNRNDDTTCGGRPCTR